MDSSPERKHGFQPSYQPVDAQNPNRQWKPRFFSSIPWLGTAGIIVAVASAVGSIVALYSANGKAVDSWPSKDTPMQLTVVLSILIAVGNVGLRIAHKEGSTLTWWIKMSKGATLAESHRTWDCGSSAWSSILGFLHLHIRKIGLVSILMAFHFANGPLIQRATDVTTGFSTEPATFKAPVSPDMFLEPTGYYQTRGPSVNTLASNFTSVYLAFTNREPIRLNLKGCEGICSGTLIGAGFDFDCTRGKQDYSIRAVQAAPGTTWEIGSIRIWNSDTENPDTIRVDTVFKGDAADVGDLTVTNCTLHSATVRYPFTYTNGTVELQGPGSTIKGMVNQTEEMVYLFREHSGLGTFVSRLGGFGYALSRAYSSTVGVYYTGPLALMASGPMAYTYMSSDDGVLGETGMTWFDPTPSILEAFNEMAFRTAVAFSNSTFEQTIQGTQQRSFIKYTVNTDFLAASLGVTFICALAIVLLYHGFWRLGRPVTMSPLEIANAFQAPVMQGTSLLRDAEDLAKALENKKVKYDIRQGIIIIADGDADNGEEHDASPDAYLMHQDGMRGH
ncbi:hypothetical protein FIE12Z_6255 [Fusarium flagelliforme]|uniref:Uncharacterized protein n=1 Tax=Fusarium flagelliforme TaxID=2675880 RepID=A0A395MNE3_9HYPO|nr:hypothetical protein FIE12Z_6255 [Fusarium flagelliforme]